MEDISADLKEVRSREQWSMLFLCFYVLRLNLIENVTIKNVSVLLFYVYLFYNKYLQGTLALKYTQDLYQKAKLKLKKVMKTVNLKPIEFSFIV